MTWENLSATVEFVQVQNLAEGLEIVKPPLDYNIYFAFDPRLEENNRRVKSLAVIKPRELEIGSWVKITTWADGTSKWEETEAP